MELKPCPFCGSPGEIVRDREYFPDSELFYYPSCTKVDIDCLACPAIAQPDGEFNSVNCSFSTPEEAAEVWNHRQAEEIDNEYS